MNITDFGNHNILIIGDIMLDRYLYGNVNRISPEAPVPILQKKELENKPGGAANVALNIKSLGSEAILLSTIGEDTDGNTLLKTLEESGISTDFIVKDKTKMTTVKTRILSGSQQLLRIDEEATTDINEATTAEIKATFLKILKKKNVEAIILQDYNKGLLSQELIEFVIEKAKENNIFVSVDPKFNNFFSYKGVDLFKPNLKEASEAISKETSTEKDNLDNIAKELHEKISYKNLFITLSSKGIYYSDSEFSEIIPTKLKDVIDVSGAGDVVLSIATITFLEKISPLEIAKISNIAGGLACGKIGVATISKKRLFEEINKA